MGGWTTMGPDDCTNETFRAFCERMTLAGYLVYLDDNGRVRLQKMQRPTTAIERGLFKHEKVLQALCKETDKLTEQERELICQHDPRLGFHRHDDLHGAIEAIRERYDFK